MALASPHRLLALTLLAIAGCGGGGKDAPAQNGHTDAAQGGQAGTGGATSDAGTGGAGGGSRPDGTAPDAAADAALPEGDALLPDAYVPPPGGQACRYAADCPAGDCIDGTCHNERPRSCVDHGDADCPEGETCGGFDNSYWCMTPCELAGECPIRSRPCSTNFECSRGTSCHGGRCTTNCETDADCGDRMCYDGECIPYPDVWTGTEPVPQGTPGQIHAGVGVVPLDYPVGVELAGFGAREGPYGPYAVALGGSDRFFEAQDVRVIALSTDTDTLLLVRLPLCWSSDLVLARAAYKLQQMTGVNYRDHIVSSATHSHSQVARYWTIVPETGFGIFGHGQFSTEIFERITDSVAAALLEAVNDMEPARVGYALEDGFDPQSRIHSDRRNENDDYKDDRVMVLRVDDAQGRPKGALMRLALHGTHMELPWVTGDAPGAVELVATEKLSAEYGREVPVMFFNGDAGDVSPRGDDGVDVPWGKMQAVGHRMWPVFQRLFDGITTDPGPSLELNVRRVPVSYGHIGYDRAASEFRSVPNGNPLIYGAFKCVNNGIPPNEPGYEDGRYACAIDLESFRGAPVPEFMKATLGAFRLGDLVVATLPGEPVSRLGRELTDQIHDDAAAAGHPEYQVIDFGYSQDHHLYLVPDEDWRHGGYEASQNIWGPKFARYITSQARALADELFTPEREVVDTGIKASFYDFLMDDTVAPTPTMGLPGGVIESPRGAVPRGALMKLRFNGGHPGVDLPYAVLEIRRDDGTFVPAVRAEGALAYDNTRFDTLTIYRGDYRADHTWEIEWELPYNAPLGTYRFHVAGRYFDGQATIPYDVLSADTFELVGAPLAVREVAVEGGQIALKITYPDGPTNNDGASPFEALETRGHLLRADPERATDDAHRRYAFIVGRDLPAHRPLHVALSGPGEAALDAVPAPTTARVSLVTSRAADGTEARQELDGWPASEVRIGAPAAGRYRVTVTDADGNAGTAEVDVP